MILLFVNHAGHQDARLVKPMLSYDNAAVALTFVPTAFDKSHIIDKETKTYGRNVYNCASSAGVNPEGRYVYPTAHLTVGRFTTTADFEDEEVTEKSDRRKITKWVEKLEGVGAWLKAECWSSISGSGDSFDRVKDGGTWVVGEEKGLDCRIGRVWYGVGDRVGLGIREGF